MENSRSFSTHRPVSGENYVFEEENCMNLRSIGFRLVCGGCLAVLIPLTVVGFVATQKSSSALETLAKSNIEETAKDMVSLINKIIDEEKKLVTAFSSGELVVSVGEIVEAKTVDGAVEEVQRLRLAMKSDYQKLGSQYLGIFVTDSRGQIYTGELEDGSEYNGANLGSMDYFQQAKQSGRAAVGDMYKSKATGDVITVVCAPILSQSGKFLGIFGMSVKAANFTDIILAKKVGETGYSFMINDQGIIIAHPVTKHVLTLDLRTVKGMEDISDNMMNQKAGINEYIFKGVDKIAGFAPVKITGWSLAITQDKDDILGASMTIRNIIIMVTIASLLLVAVVIFLASKAITKPINQAVTGLKDIAEGEGDLTMRLPVTTKDEVGEMARWFNVFIEKLQNIIKDIGSNTKSVDESAGGLTDISNNLSNTADSTSNLSESVAAAAEEMSGNLNNVAAGMEESTINTSMVASAAEEMTATINEIAQNAEHAHTISEEAVVQAQNTSNKMNELSEAAQAISKVTETITEISEQTNLLALNATIEAARAGEAGKGFAVVANEIKELAKQTAEATLDIKKQIDGVQGTTSSTITEIDQISSVINSVNEIVATISSAVGEQSSATEEIATNISQASQGLGEVNENVNQISAVAGSITEDIGNVNMASNEISDSSSQVKGSAEALSELASRLHVIVNNFKV